MFGYYVELEDLIEECNEEPTVQKVVEDYPQCKDCSAQGCINLDF